MSAPVEAFERIQEESFARAGAGLRQSYPRRRAMDGPTLQAFLEERRYAVMATTRPDGRAHAAPIAFAVWRGAFWLASVEGARLGNLRARPYASLVIMQGEGDEHRAVIAEGPASLHAPESMPEELAGLWRERFGSLPGWAAALIELRPERIFSYARGA